MTGPELIRKALAARLAPDPIAPLILSLTTAERAIARLLAEDHSDREIASALGKTETTVKQQVAGVLHKLGQRNREQATAVLKTRLDLL